MPRSTLGLQVTQMANTSIPSCIAGEKKKNPSTDLVILNMFIMLELLYLKLD